MSEEHQESSEIGQINETLKELRNYQGTQIQLQASSQTDLESQLAAIHDTSEQVNQGLRNSLKCLEDSSEQQRKASMTLIEAGYKEFQESVEQTASRNEQMLGKLLSEQKSTDERLLEMQDEQNEQIRKLGEGLNRRMSETAESVDRQSRDQLKNLGNRMSWYQIRNYLIATIPTSIITASLVFLGLWLTNH